MIESSRLRELADRIARQFHPERIILFGSYAYGQPRTESDVDLLVVMDTHLSELQQAARICQSIDYHFGLDLLVRTPANLARRRLMGDPFVCDILDKGKILYERAHG